MQEQQGDGVLEQAATGQEAEAPDEAHADIPVKQPWNRARYEGYILSRYSDFINDREQVPDIHTTAFVIGWFFGTLWVIDDNKDNGQAFVKTPAGPIELRREPMAWNPTNRDMLDKLCQHVIDNQNPGTRIGYAVTGNNAMCTLQIPDITTYEVSRSHPWYPDYG